MYMWIIVDSVTGKGSGV